MVAAAADDEVDGADGVVAVAEYTLEEVIGFGIHQTLRYAPF